MRIILVGYRGSGKSTVGRILAEKLSMDFYDSDELIEEVLGEPIASFVERNGWAPFRAVEEGVVKALSSRDSFVLASGGGTFLNKKNFDCLRRNSVFFFLWASPAAIKARISGSLRPSLTGKDPLEEVDEVLKERMPIYIAISNYIIDTDRLSPEDVANEIFWIVKGRF